MSPRTDDCSKESERLTLQNIDDSLRALPRFGSLFEELRDSIVNAKG